MLITNSITNTYLLIQHITKYYVLNIFLLFIIIIELTQKYEDQVGLNCINVPLFECNWKVLEGFLSSQHQHILSSYSRKSCHFLCHLCAYASRCSSHDLCTPLNRIKLKKGTQNCLTFFCPKLVEHDFPPQIYF